MSKTESQQNVALVEVLQNVPRGWIPFFKKKLNATQLAEAVSKLLYPEDGAEAANPNFVTSGRKSLLAFASSFEEETYSEVVKVLLQHQSINPDDWRDPTTHRTALMVNVENGNLENVKNFLDAKIISQNKVNVNLVDIHRKSALMIAAEKGDLEMVKTIIELRKDDVNLMLADQHGKTILEICKENLDVPEKIREEVTKLIEEEVQRQIARS